MRSPCKTSSKCDPLPMNAQALGTAPSQHVESRRTEDPFTQRRPGWAARVGVVALLALVQGTAAFAATAPNLGSTSTYGIVSDTFTNSNTSPQTIINGNVCYTTGPSTPPLSTTAPPVTPCPPVTGVDQGSALADLNGQACTFLGAGAIALDSVVIGANPPGTIPPGCYYSGGAMSVTLSTTVTLSGQGIYVFRPGGALNTGDNSSVILAGGACAGDVYWAPVGATTLGANAAPSLTPTFVGNILDAAGITIGHFANLTGRALAFGGTAPPMQIPLPSRPAHLWRPTRVRHPTLSRVGDRRPCRAPGHRWLCRYAQAGVVVGT